VDRPLRRPYDIRYKLTGNLDGIKIWLAQNYQGSFEFDILPSNMGGPAFAPADVIFRFEEPDDRDRFRDMILAEEAR